MQSKEEQVTFAIVEDEAIEREGLALFIEEQFTGAKVIWTATDGEEGLQQVIDAPPDILIIDIEMPVMNGLELCEKLYHRGFEGVMLIHTAYAKFSYARKAVALNVFDYILKPMDDADLKDTLQRCIQEYENRRRARRQKAEKEHVVQDVKQFALSLVTLGTMDSRHRDLFFQTVGWPEGQTLRTWVIKCSGPSAFTGSVIRSLSAKWSPVSAARPLRRVSP